MWEKEKTEPDPNRHTRTLLGKNKGYGTKFTSSMRYLTEKEIGGSTWENPEVFYLLKPFVSGSL